MCLLLALGAVASRLSGAGAAVQRSRDRYARSLGHTHTLQFALAYGGAYFAAHCRDADYLDATTSEMVETRQGPFVSLMERGLTGLLGMLLIERGQTRDGIAGLRPVWRRSGSSVRCSGSRPSVPGWPGLTRHAGRFRRDSPPSRWGGRSRPAANTGWTRNCIAPKANFGRSKDRLTFPAPKCVSARPRGRPGTVVAHSGVARRDQPCTAMAAARTPRPGVGDARTRGRLVHGRTRQRGSA